MLGISPYRSAIYLESNNDLRIIPQGGQSATAMNCLQTPDMIAVTEQHGYRFAIRFSLRHPPTHAQGVVHMMLLLKQAQITDRHQPFELTVDGTFQSLPAAGAQSLGR